MSREDKLKTTEERPDTSSNKSPFVRIGVGIAIFVLLGLIFTFIILPKLKNSQSNPEADFLINGKEAAEGLFQIEEAFISLEATGTGFSNISWAIASEDQIFDTVSQNNPMFELTLPKSGEYTVRLNLINEANESFTQSKTILFEFSETFKKNLTLQFKELLERYLESKDRVVLTQILSICSSSSIPVSIEDTKGRSSTLPLNDLLQEKTVLSNRIQSIEVSVDEFGKIKDAKLIENKTSAKTAQVDKEKSINSPNGTAEENIGSRLENNQQQKKPDNTKSKGSESNPEIKKTEKPVTPALKPPVIELPELELSINNLNNNDPSRNWKATQQQINQLIATNFADNCEFIRVSSAGYERPLHKSFKSFLEEVALIYEEEEMIQIKKIEYNSEGKIIKFYFIDPI